MFKGHNVVTDKDVGDYIRQLQHEGSKELNNFILGDEDEMVGSSTEPTDRTQDTPEL